MFDNVIPQAEACGNAWLKRQLKLGRVERFCEIVDVTPQLAEQMLALNASNRNLRGNVVARYRKIIEENRWRLTIEGIGFDTNKMLRQGQHRLTAVVESGKTVPFTVWFGMDPDEFQVLDQGATRTAGDLAHIAGQDYSNQRAALARLLLRLEGDYKLTDSAAVLAKSLEVDNEFTKEAIQQGMTVKKTLVHPAAAILAYYWIGSYTKKPGKLAAFWYALVTGADLDKSSPILKLRNMLPDAYVAKGNGKDRTIKLSASIVLAWNAYARSSKKCPLNWKSGISLPDVV